MASVEGTKGNTVKVTVVGVTDTIDYLKRKNGELLKAKDIALAKAGAYVANEVQMSIMGIRDEPKSVDTGKFANSISVKDAGDDVLIVYPKNVPYAIFLEEGTSKLAARKHFKNTEYRTKKKVRAITLKEIKEAINN